jgi:hypothetical protein
MAAVTMTPGALEAGSRAEALAHYAWLVEPDKDSAELMDLTELDFTPFDGKQLDRVLAGIKGWYQRLTTSLLAEAG